MSSCMRISSPNRHSSSLAVLSRGVCTSSSSLLLLKLLLMLVATVAAVASLPPRLRLLLFLNHPRLLLVPVASMSDAVEEPISGFSARVCSVLAVVLVLESTLVKALEVVEAERECDGLFDDGVGVAGSAVSAIGSRRGVGTGVMSVDGVTSTSSASRYHFRRRV